MRLTLKMVAAILVVGIMAGCGTKATTDNPLASGGVGDGSSAPTQSHLSDPTQTAEPTPTAAQGTSGKASVKDADGYTFDVQYGYSLLAVDKGLASEKPGLNSAVMSERSTISIVNTTASRDLKFQSVSGVVAPLSDPHLYLVALWKLTSPVCVAAVKMVFVESSTPVAYCGVVITFGRVPNTVSAGETVDLKVYSGVDNGMGLAGVAHIPDADYVAVSEALKHPDNFEIVYSSDDNTRFAASCKRSSQADAEASAVYNNGLMPLWAATGMCDQFYSVPQPAE